MKFFILTISILMLSIDVRAQSGSARSEPTSLRDVIKSYSTSSGEAVLVDPRVKGQVALFDPSNAELSYEKLSTILNVHNFGTYRSGDYLVVVPQNILKAQPTPLVTADGKYATNQNVIEVVKLDKVCPTNIIPVLRPLLPPTSHFTPMLSPRLILITGTYGNIKRIKEIVTVIESNTEKRQVCSE